MLNPGSSSDGGKSKYESSVQHAMASWHQALRPDAEVSSGSGGSSSVAQQRRDLLQRVLAQSEESHESEQGGARAVTGGTPQSVQCQSAPLVRPHHYEDFLARMRSFKSSTWFAKPNCISATQCARFGWVNASSDRLHCKSCLSSLVHARDDTNGLEVLNRLRSAHELTCAWNQPGAHSPSAFLSPPRFECMDSVLESLVQRLRDNWGRLMSSLPTHCTSLEPLMWPTLGLTVPVGTGVEPLDVAAVLRGEGGADENYIDIAVALAEYIFERMSSAKIGCNGPTTEQRGLIINALRSHGLSDASMDSSITDNQTEMLLHAYCLTVYCSLLGLELQAGAECTSGLSVGVHCSLCETSVKQKNNVPLVLVRSHRSFCPHVSGHVPCPDDDENGDKHHVPVVPVPAGWHMALECLLAVTVGIDRTEDLLGQSNMYFCLPGQTRMRNMSSRKRSISPVKQSDPNKGSSDSVASGVKGGGSSTTSSPQVQSRRSSRGGHNEEEDDSPFGIYKKIKSMLES